MSVKRDPRTGHWFYRKVVRLPDGTKPRLFGTPAKFNLPDTKAGAEEAERMAIAHVRETGTTARPVPEQPAPPKKVATLIEYANDQWLPFARIDVRPSTVRAKEKALRRLLRALPELGDMPIDKVDKLTIDKVRQRLVEAGHKPGTVNFTLAQLRNLLGSAHEHDLVESVPRVRLLRNPPTKVDFLSPEEWAQLMAADVPPIVHLMMLVAGQTGLRIGELRALEWADVDFERRQLLVRRTLSEGKLQPPKSGRNREVPLPRTSLESLIAWRMQATSPLVFPGRAGTVNGRPVYLTEDTVYTWLHAAAAAAGVRRLSGWHIFRHTYASRLVQGDERGNNRASLPEVQVLLGHASIAMTQRYAHLAPSNLHRAITVLDAA